MNDTLSDHPELEQLANKPDEAEGASLGSANIIILSFDVPAALHVFLATTQKMLVEQLATRDRLALRILRADIE